jgi:hypothetical protein
MREAMPNWSSAASSNAGVVVAATFLPSIYRTTPPVSSQLKAMCIQWSGSGLAGSS